MLVLQIVAGLAAKRVFDDAVKISNAVHQALFFKSIECAVQRYPVVVAAEVLLEIGVGKGMVVLHEQL